MEAGVGLSSPQFGGNRLLSLQDPLWPDLASTRLRPAGHGTVYQDGGVESNDASGHAGQLSDRCVISCNSRGHLFTTIFVQQSPSRPNSNRLMNSPITSSCIAVDL